jgi:hypothetical protein
VKVEDLESYYPSLANIKKKFYFDIVSFEIALPAQFEELNLHDEILREQIGNEAKQAALSSYKAEYNASPLTKSIVRPFSAALSALMNLLISTSNSDFNFLVGVMASVYKNSKTDF